MENLARVTTCILLLSSLFEEISCFTIPRATKKTALFLPSPEFTRQNQQHQHQRRCIIALNAEKKKKNSNQDNSSPKGFGNKGKTEITTTKTYDDGDNDDDYDSTDSNTDVEDFFRRRQEWNPLFRSIVGFTTDAQTSSSEDFYSPPLPLAINLMQIDNGRKETLDALFWDDDQRPWKKLPAIPTGENDIAVIGTFLDSAQQALVEIPVEENSEDDANDMHFIEEGRRCLVLSRFQVLGGGSEVVEDGGTEGVGLKMEEEEELFSTCWSEITCLVQENEKDTGSLIMLPNKTNSDMGALREFTERNILRPLDWLGLGDTLEVASMQRGIPAIRLIHKLSDIREPQPDTSEEQ